MEELPIHPNLKDKTPWNISSDIKAPIHREKVRSSDFLKETANECF